MDWRNRKYYLVTLGYGIRHCGRFQMLKRIPSVKFSKPYNHIFPPIKDAPEGYLGSINYDGKHTDETGMRYVQYMISCNDAQSESVENLLNNFHNDEPLYCYWFELTKEICGQ